MQLQRTRKCSILKHCIIVTTVFLEKTNLKDLLGLSNLELFKSSIVRKYQLFQYRVFIVGLFE